MGLLADIFDMDEETEKDIKDVVKAVGLIALLIGGAGAAGGSLDLPFDNDDSLIIPIYNINLLTIHIIHCAIDKSQEYIYEHRSPLSGAFCIIFH